MLLEEETQNKFGYYIKDLIIGSHKKIVVKCDYCENIYDVIMKNRSNQNKIIDKDCCNKCKYIKREEMSLKLYGVKNSAQREDVRQKIRDNCPFNNEETQQKIKETMLERYGVEQPMHSEELRNKQKEVILNKYGVENVSQVKEFQEKRKQTNLERFGSEQFLGSKYARQIIKDSIDEINEKIKQSKIKNGTIKLYNGKTISELLKDSKYSDSGFRHLVDKYGFEAAIKMDPKISSLEVIFREWLSSLNIKWVAGYKVENCIPDLYLPDYNLLLEFNGLYWHCDSVVCDKFYHFNKKSTYEKNNFKSMFFYEDEINNKLNIVKSMILNKCGLSNRIYARKCVVDFVDKDEANHFLEQNHLMGNGSGESLGLRYDNELVFILRMRKKDDGYEISRTCSKLGINVVGGFSRTLNHFINENNDVKEIYTFIDKRYGEGNYLKELGFELKTNFLSFKWTDFTHTFHRMQFRSNTGYLHNMFKIWDCGQFKFCKSLS